MGLSKGEGRVKGKGHSRLGSRYCGEVCGDQERG